MNQALKKTQLRSLPEGEQARAMSHAITRAVENAISKGVERDAAINGGIAAVLDLMYRHRDAQDLGESAQYLRAAADWLDDLNRAGQEAH